MKVVFDLETHLIAPGMIMPRLVCMSYAIEDNPPVLLDRQQTLEQVRKWFPDPSMEYIGQHNQYDFGVLAAEDITLLPHIFRAYEEGRIHDTKIRQQLIDIGNGELKFHEAEAGEEDDEEDEDKKVQYILKTQYSLDALAWRLCRLKVQKADTWRLKYALLDGVPIEQWPKEAIDYAVGDTLATREVYNEQRRRYPTKYLVNSAKQHQAAWALHLMSAWGIRTDGALVEKLDKHLDEELAIAHKKLSVSGLMHPFPNDTKRNMKAIRQRVLAAYQKLGLDLVYTEKGGAKILALHAANKPVPEEVLLKGISTAADTLKVAAKSGDDDLRVLAESSKDSKLKNTYVPILQRGTMYPINASYNVLVESGRTSCSKPNCFDGYTEVLTRKGWVKFSDLKEGIEVAEYRKDGSIDFVVPTQVIKYKYTGQLIRLKNDHIDLQVTPDHRCLLVNRKLGYLDVFEAKEYKEDWIQLNAGKYVWGKGIPFSDDDLRMLVAVQADGSYHDSGISFTFFKERKWTRLFCLLKALNVEYSVYDKFEARYGGKTGKGIRVLASTFVEKIRNRLGYEKIFGNWLLDMTQHQAQVFEEEIWHWDGCLSRKSMYSSSDEINVDWVQTILSLMNIRAKKRSYVPPSENARLNYQVDVSRKNYSMTTNISRTFIDWDDDVYCVSVPSTYIMVRRGNNVMITGQCQNPPRKGGVRECFVPRGPVYEQFDVPDYYVLGPNEEFI